MSEKALFPWEGIDEYIDEEYRALLVQIALRHLPAASRGLQSVARGMLSKAINIPGFRSFDRLSEKRKHSEVIAKMRKSPDVATAVIGLWGEAMSSFIREFRAAAEKKGMCFRPNWTWEQAIEGYHRLEDVPALDQFCKEWTAGKSEPEIHHARLAALWLSRALTDGTGHAVDPGDAVEVDGRAGGGSEGTEEERPPATGATRVEPEAPQDTGTADDGYESLDSLSTKVDQFVESCKDIHRSTLNAARNLVTALEGADSERVNAGYATLSGEINRWDGVRKQLPVQVRQAARALDRELKSRPDLPIDAPYKELVAHPDRVKPPQRALEQVQALVTHVRDYDRDRQRTREAMVAAERRIAELHANLDGWETSEPHPAAIESRHAVRSNPSATLDQLRTALAELDAERGRLESLHNQFRASAIERIEAARKKWEELDVAASEQAGASPTLAGPEAGDLAKLTTAELLALEKRLKSRIEEEQIKEQKHAFPILVAELRDDWNNQNLEALLAQLALKRRDAEALLVLLAANIAHPRSEALVPAPTVVKGLLRSILELSEPAQPFELLNRTATHFIQGWKTEDPTALTGLCLAFIGAQFACDRPLPTGLLWDLTQEWPIRGMSNWETLWQAVLLEAAMPRLYSRNPARSEAVLKARAAAEQVLASERGTFIRLRTVKHREYALVLGEEFFTPLVERLGKLREIHDALAGASPSKVAQAVNKLKSLKTDSTAWLLDEQDLNARYAESTTSAHTLEDETFYRRTGLKVLLDAVESVREYEQELTRFGEEIGETAGGVCLEDLAAELEKSADVRALGHQVLDQIKARVEAERVRDEDEAWSKAMGQLTRRLLRDAVYVQRLARFMAHLVSAELELPEFLDDLLEDIARPLDPDSAAQLLLEREASQQVILLTPHISLELQKRAQLMSADKERQISELQTELLKVGGNGADLAQDRALGRWALVSQELEKRLAVQQAQYQAETKRQHDWAGRIRREINDLDGILFQARASIPLDSYNLFERGLNSARQLTNASSDLSLVESFLKEARYRLEHRSWSLLELQDAVEPLERAARGESAAQKSELDARQVYVHLENDDLVPLGLGSEVSSSEVGTRTELLRNWLRVGELQTAVTAELARSDRDAIQAMFRYFGQMVKLKHGQAPDGSYLDLVDSVSFSYWELQHPKTDVLKADCILMALPGRPPRPDQIKLIQDLIDQKEWLNYSFVLLFVPGCTEKIRNRLLSHYSNRKLVIIDEPALLDMVLAEAKDRSPLGRLRSTMLRACGAESVEIFRVNQLVNPRTAIFVGRDRIIERIVNSDGSFAVYGGRRIGKSSVLMAIGGQLEQRNVQVVTHSFDGEPDCTDDASARKLAQLMQLELGVQGMAEFKFAVQSYLDGEPAVSVVLLLDEIDKYIQQNPKRHVLIEALRSLADQYAGRFRIVVAGFMDLYDCIGGRGPYSPASDPWQRMLNDIGPLPNVAAASAEKIVREGFLEILGWDFENRGIERLVVEHTGGHPAFVQQFCSQVQQRVAKRGDRRVKIGDIEEVFADPHPEHSFIAYVGKTLEMNLDPISRYLILWIAGESQKTNSFTRDQAEEIARTSKTEIPEAHLTRSLERLKVNSVVEERSPGVYEFSVPDYPLILDRLGRTAHLERLEDEIKEYLRTHDQAK